MRYGRLTVCFICLTIRAIVPRLKPNLLKPDIKERLAPFKKAKRGRPKVARIGTNYKIDKRIKLRSICRQDGHNRRVCRNKPVEHGRAQKARDHLVKGKYYS